MSKHCPYCNKSEFTVMVTKPALVDFSGDEPVIKVEKKDINLMKFEILQCYSCKKKVTNDEVVSTLKCSKCEKVCSQEDLINGICLDCFLEANPEFKKLSMAQLIKKVVELQSVPKEETKEPAKEETKPKQEEVKKTEENKKVEENKKTEDNKNENKDETAKGKSGKTTKNKKEEQPSNTKDEVKNDDKKQEETKKEETKKEEKEEDIMPPTSFDGFAEDPF